MTYLGEDCQSPEPVHAGFAAEHLRWPVFETWALPVPPLLQKEGPFEDQGGFLRWGQFPVL